MSTLLKIDVSPRGDIPSHVNSATTSRPSGSPTIVGGEIITRDLATTKIPYVDLPWIAGAFTAPDKHTVGDKAALKIIRRTHRGAPRRRRSRHLHSDV